VKVQPVGQAAAVGATPCAKSHDCVPRQCEQLCVPTQTWEAVGVAVQVQPLTPSVWSAALALPSQVFWVLKPAQDAVLAVPEHVWFTALRALVKVHSLGQDACVVAVHEHPGLLPQAV